MPLCHKRSLRAVRAGREPLQRLAVDHGQLFKLYEVNSALTDLALADPSLFTVESVGNLLLGKSGFLPRSPKPGEERPVSLRV